jgi:hypothetical protein
VNLKLGLISVRKVAVRVDVMSEQLILGAEIVVHADNALMNRQVTPR